MAAAKKKAPKAKSAKKVSKAAPSKVTARANRFYLLEYCSPKRSGQHTVKVVANWTAPTGEKLVGGMSRTFDATGFASGCELTE